MDKSGDLGNAAISPPRLLELMNAAGLSGRGAVGHRRRGEAVVPDSGGGLERLVARRTYFRKCKRWRWYRAERLLVSLAITVLATNRVLRPLRRIERDHRSHLARKVSEPNGSGGNRRAAGPREFAAVESKLNLLGQQYRGAQRDATELQHSVDEMMERMANQLDVASRLAAISRITGGVAHEIKNPLNAIVLRLDLAESPRQLRRSGRGVDSRDRYSLARSAASRPRRQNVPGFLAARRSPFRGTGSRRAGRRSRSTDNAAGRALGRPAHLRTARITR